MSSVRFETDDSQTYRIIGELNMSTVPQLLQDMAAVFSTSQQARVIDLTDVSRSDSAGLALLLEWQRLAQEQGLQLTFRNLPEQMQAIIKVSGLEKLISG
ncbi:MAG: STAS domain-containing protein [Thioalkalispiraceae bacterium]|jgi:phospholipid transport system transporter-binding protein